MCYASKVTRRVSYEREAVKMLMRMDRTTAQRIRRKVEQLAADPDSLTNNVQPLRGINDVWRLRVGDWRVLYTSDLVVLSVIRVAPRGSAYE